MPTEMIVMIPCNYYYDYYCYYYYYYYHHHHHHHYCVVYHPFITIIPRSIDVCQACKKRGRRSNPSKQNQSPSQLRNPIPPSINHRTFLEPNHQKSASQSKQAPRYSVIAVFHTPYSVPPHTQPSAPIPSPSDHMFPQLVSDYSVLR
jgi:hypothetical protein